MLINETIALLITIASQGDHCLAYNHCWSRRQLPGLEPMRIKETIAWLTTIDGQEGQQTQMGTTNTNGGQPNTNGDNKHKWGQPNTNGTKNTNGDNKQQTQIGQHTQMGTTYINWTTDTNGDNSHKWGQQTQQLLITFL